MTSSGVLPRDVYALVLVKLRDDPLTLHHCQLAGRVLRDVVNAHPKW